MPSQNIKPVFPAFFFAVIALNINLADAHEFWIEPESCQLDAGDKIRATVNVGEYFKGNTYPFIKRGYWYAGLNKEKKVVPVRSTLGIDPAISQPNLGDGLNIFIIQSGYTELMYDKFETFQKFLKTFGQEEIEKKHFQRGYGKDDFKEVYARFTKTLINVGENTGQDKAIGLSLEWVALDNPYTSKKPSLRFQLLNKGKPAPQKTTYLYSKIRGEKDTSPLQLQTDENGIVTVTPDKGQIHMLSAVLVRQPGARLARQYSAAWESRWSSIIFCR